MKEWKGANEKKRQEKNRKEKNAKEKNAKEKNAKEEKRSVLGLSQTNIVFHRAAPTHLQTFAQPCSVLLGSGVVKRTKHFGQYFLSFVGAFAVLHKESKQDNTMRRLDMRCSVKCCIRWIRALHNNQPCSEVHSSLKN